MATKKSPEEVVTEDAPEEDIYSQEYRDSHREELGLPPLEEDA